MRVFTFSCDPYYHILRMFVHQFLAHWDDKQEVVIVGFSPLPFTIPPNFSFVSVGEFKDYPVNRWSDAVIKYLESVNDEVFVLMLEDYLLVRDVNIDAVRILADYMSAHEDIIRIDLAEDRLHASGTDMNYGYIKYIDLIKSAPGSPYHMSLWPGLWRRSNILKILQKGWTPWDVEIAGNNKLSAMPELLVLGTKQGPVRITLAARGGDPGKIDITALSYEDQKSLISEKRWKPA